MSKATIPKGTRDFSPEQMLKRDYVFNIIKETFYKYGYKQIQTPAIEKLETLTGKYGEEGDRLIFKILKRGDKLKKEIQKFEDNALDNNIEKSFCDQALRYDLTVPTARYVVQHKNDINFPFKRFQIQPVWRADRPQKGRYREFYQLDADVIGSNSLLNELEIILLIDSVFTELKIPDFTIKINNRKILSAIAEVTGESDKIIDITIAIDKLDKIGEQGVIKELVEKNISQKAIEIIKPILKTKGNFKDVILKLKEIISTSEIGVLGIEELETIFTYIEKIELKSAKLVLDMTLARGLNYYTGAIFEVTIEGAKLGSVCGGGRYDDLTSVFGLKDVSGVGISFGADRIIDILEDFSLYPEFISSATKLLIINSEDTNINTILLAEKFRNEGINTEIYPDKVKVKKQLKYANNNNITFVVFIENDSVMQLKNMLTGEQKICKEKEIMEEILRI